MCLSLLRAVLRLEAKLPVAVVSEILLLASGPGFELKPKPNGRSHPVTGYMLYQRSKCAEFAPMRLGLDPLLRALGAAWKNETQETRTQWNDKETGEKRPCFENWKKVKKVKRARHAC